MERSAENLFQALPISGNLFNISVIDKSRAEYNELIIITIF